MLPSQDGACRCPPPLCWQARRDRRRSGTGTLSGEGGDFIGIVSGRVSSVADLSRGGALWTGLLRGLWVMTGSLPGRRGGWDEKGGKGGLSIRLLWTECAAEGFCLSWVWVPRFVWHTLGRGMLMGDALNGRKLFESALAGGVCAAIGVVIVRGHENPLLRTWRRVG